MDQSYKMMAKLEPMRSEGGDSGIDVQTPTVAGQSMSLSPQKLLSPQGQQALQAFTAGMKDEKIAHASVLMPDHEHAHQQSILQQTLQGPKAATSQSHSYTPREDLVQTVDPSQRDLGQSQPEPAHCEKPAETTAAEEMTTIREVEHLQVQAVQVRGSIDGHPTPAALLPVMPVSEGEPEHKQDDAATDVKETTGELALYLILKYFLCVWLVTHFEVKEMNMEKSVITHYDNEQIITKFGKAFKIFQISNGLCKNVLF